MWSIVGHSSLAHRRAIWHSPKYTLLGVLTTARNNTGDAKSLATISINKPPRHRCIERAVHLPSCLHLHRLVLFFYQHIGQFWWMALGVVFLAHTATFIINLALLKEYIWEILRFKLWMKLFFNKDREETSSFVLTWTHLARWSCPVDDKWEKLTTNWKPIDGRKTRGYCLKIRWQDEIKGFGGVHWMELAKEEWKTLADTFVQKKERHD